MNYSFKTIDKNKYYDNNKKYKIIKEKKQSFKEFKLLKYQNN